jgi:hypothetical protein
MPYGPPSGFATSPAGFVAAGFVAAVAVDGAGLGGVAAGLGVVVGFAEAIVLSTFAVSASAASDSARAAAVRLSAVRCTAAACSAASRFFADARIVVKANAAPATTTITPITHGHGEGPFGVHSVSSVDINFSRSLGEMYGPEGAEGGVEGGGVDGLSGASMSSFT